MKLIPLTQGKFTMVDDEDFEFLNQHKWCVERNGKTNSHYYAVRANPLKRGLAQLRMHRIIMNTPAGMEVDHIDHDTLNNQKYNLRNVTHKQNVQNTSSWVKCRSAYRGVSFETSRQKWTAKIKVNQKTLNLGRFYDEKEAAKAYDEAAKRHFGEFANLNFKNND